MKVYKLTDADGRTYCGTQWGDGITHETSGKGDLCGPGWLRFYYDPLLAVLLNPIHAEFPEGMHLWEAEAEGQIKDNNGLMGGCTRLTTLREILVPYIEIEQRVQFAILCAKEVCIEPMWVEWANNWLSGKNRSEETAEARAERAAAEWEARMAETAAAERAAREAVIAAASAAEWAVREEDARAKWAAMVAVRAAVEAASMAVEAKKIDLTAIARMVTTHHE